MSAVALLAMTVGFGVAVMDNRRICRGVFVADVEVGGLTPEEARLRLQQTLWARLDAAMTLTHGQRAWRLTPRKLGIALAAEETVKRADRVGKEGGFFAQLRERLRLLRHPQPIPPLFVAPQGGAQRLLSLQGQVNKPSANAYVVLSGDAVRVVPEVMGARLDAEATVNTIADALSRVKPIGTVPLAVKTDLPPITARELADVNCVLASFSTRFSPSKKSRTHNMRLAASFMDKTFVPTGGTFSYNERVGLRSAQRGFKRAPIFVDGEIEEGIGGGVCQVATTVYNAALLSGQKVKTRTRHSRPVDYVPRGRDATVVDGGSDLKFVNSFPHPVYLRAALVGNRVTIWVLGNSADKRSIKLVQVKDAAVPFGVTTIPDPSLPPGKEVVVKKGRNGYRTTVARLIELPDGTQKRETLSTNHYRPQNKVVRVGAKREENTLPAPPTGDKPTAPVSSTAHATPQTTARRGE